MKKIAMLLCAVLGLTAQAQQLPNGNFDGDWEANHPYIGSNNTRTTGDQPVGWCVANVDGVKGTGKQKVADKVSGVSGEAVKLTNSVINVIIVKQTIPGYMCLGSTWNTSVGTTSIKNKDGGSFGGYELQGYKPDALEFMYQCTGGTGSVVAYLWKGSWTQKDVPVTTVMSGNPLKVTMIDRDRNILGIAHSQGGEVTKSADAELIASLQQSITDTPTKWTKRTIEFDYKNANAVPEKINVIFSSTDYFDSNNIVANNTLTVDDVKLVYYSQLKALAVNGTPVADFATDKYEYTVDKEYTEGCLTTEVKGVAATQTVAYNEETGVATITVKGQDWTESNRNEHVYTVQFVKPAAPALASLKISGEDFALAENVVEYELPYAYNKGIVFEPVADEASTLGDVVYNDEDKTVSITVKNEKGAETVYVFRFGQLDETAAESGDYNGALSVVLITPDATSNGLLENAAIALSKNASGTYNLTLNNFAFMGMTVGDIFVPNITLTDGKLEAQRTIMITSDDESAMGPMLGALPVKVSAILVDTDKKAAAASIDILTSETDLSALFQGIHVDFVPYEVEGVGVDGAEWGGPQHYENVKVSGRVTKETAKFLHINNNYVNSEGVTEEYPMTYIDMTAATVDADVTVADIMAGAPEKNNTLIYLPANSKLTDANTVVNGKAATLALTEKVTFFAPTAFEAASVHFDRTFNTADNYVSSFVMPFEMNVSEVKGDVYKFKGIDTEKNEVQFEKVNEGVLDANKPYLVVATDAAPLNAVANVNVAVTEDELAQTAGNAAHIGSYTVQTVTSDANATYYGYQNGEFVKANNGTLNPFRTMIKVTGAAGANVLTLKLEGTTTGINEAVSETGKTDVYTIDGKCVRRGVAAKDALNGLEKGVYVVNGRKIVK